MGFCSYALITFSKTQQFLEHNWEFFNPITTAKVAFLFLYCRLRSKPFFKQDLVFFGYNPVVVRKHRKELCAVLFYFLKINRGFKPRPCDLMLFASRKILERKPWGGKNHSTYLCADRQALQIAQNRLAADTVANKVSIFVRRANSFREMRNPRINLRLPRFRHRRNLHLKT